MKNRDGNLAWPDLCPTESDPILAGLDLDKKTKWVWTSIKCLFAKTILVWIFNFDPDRPCDLTIYCACV